MVRLKANTNINNMSQIKITTMLVSLYRYGRCVMEYNISNTMPLYGFSQNPIMFQVPEAFKHNK